MNFRNFLVVTMVLCCAAAGQVSAAPSKGSSGEQCPIGNQLANAKTPLAGLWRVNAYREINGVKNYATAGDAVLIVPTLIPGEVCVEFTSPVEGSQHYYLALEPDGKTIDETVYTEYGGELRILFRYRSADSVTFVLYHRPLGGTTAAKGGPDEGGAVGEVESWD